ncbi:MAG TPA: 5-dehydro-4-deoxy-D-glucuronate isomerase [Dermatophilaceae bacterium]|jgi:4-deoxy-L-threo-5-hexosulose-uronate ketol-isomerase
MFEIRYGSNPRAIARMSTAELREQYLSGHLFTPGQINGAYLHDDRIVVLGVVPTDVPLEIPTYDPLRADFLLQRREAGIINVGGPGAIEADGEPFEMAHTACLYLGRGTRQIRMTSADPANPAAFYVFSAAAHVSLPAKLVRPGEGAQVELGTSTNVNRRTLNQCIWEGGAPSAQIVMGFTQVHSGSAWNSMPAHTHDRRTECYLYFDLPEEERVLHVMGEPQQTRHLVVANRELVISPSWSVHFGAGTANYTFVWATAGENQTFDDMDQLSTSDLR